MEVIHGVQRPGYICPNAADEGDKALLFEVQMAAGKTYTPCPVVGCMGGASDLHVMYRHFAYRHPEVEVIINNKPLERCKLCKMFTPDADRHGRSQTCKKLQKKRANIDAASIQQRRFNSTTPL